MQEATYPESKRTKGEKKKADKPVGLELYISTSSKLTLSNDTNGHALSTHTHTIITIGNLGIVHDEPQPPHNARPVAFLTDSRPRNRAALRRQRPGTPSCIRRLCSAL